MRALRKLPFFIAAALLGLVLFVELGGAIAGPFGDHAAAAVGWGIPCLALVDGQLVFTVLLMVAPLLLPERLTGRMQGVASLVVAILLVLGCLACGFGAVALLMLLVGLLLALPFGPVAYAGLGYASFPTGTAAAMLGLVMLCKLVSGGALILGHQRFLENKGLVLMFLSSLAATLILSFCHSFVASFLVSVSDLVGAIVIVIIAAVWAIISLFFSVAAIGKAIS